MDKVSIYPNPLKNTFTLNIGALKLNNIDIQIFNVIGKKVFEERNLKSENINVSHLNSGVYILKIMNESMHKTIKIVKR